MRNLLDLLNHLKTSAIEDHQRRLDAVIRDLHNLMVEVPSSPEHDVRELTALLLAMNTDEVYILLGRLIHVEPAGTLGALESINHFVRYYMLDDGECAVVPEPLKADFSEDPVYCSALRAAYVDNPDASRKVLEEIAFHAYWMQPRPDVVIRHTTKALPAELILAIERNRKLKSDRDQTFATIFESIEAISSGPQP